MNPVHARVSFTNNTVGTVQLTRIYGHGWNCPAIVEGYDEEGCYYRFLSEKMYRLNRFLINFTTPFELDPSSGEFIAQAQIITPCYAAGQATADVTTGTVWAKFPDKDD